MCTVQQCIMQFKKHNNILVQSCPVGLMGNKCDPDSKVRMMQKN